ncbi:hypothetical protein U9Z84_05030, partial [Escherichia coli]
MSIKLTTMQAAYLTRAMTTGGGLIELGELAKGLGKQKAHVVRKLEANFDKERLSKMETHLTVMGGNYKNVAQTVKTYMLDYKTAGALAMSYDLQLGVEVLTLLEEAVQTIGAMTSAVQAGDTQAALVNRPGFPGECFICELRLPDHRFRWKHNKLFLLLPVGYGPAFPA